MVLRLWRRFRRWFYDALSDLYSSLGTLGGWFDHQGVQMSYRATDLDDRSGKGEQ